MKNKKLIYVLIPSAVAIWGVVIYKALFAGSDPEVSISASISGNQSKAAVHVQDTFQLSGAYPDPFLERQLLKNRRGYRHASLGSAGKKPKPKPKKPVKTKPEVRWPAISYNGLIQGDSKHIALMVISKKNHVLGEGETVENIKLVKIHPDSVILELDGKRKAFIKH